LSGIAAAVQLERLGIPYVVYERRSEIGGTWSINKYPDIRVDTLSSTYEYSYEDQYPWTEYFARGEEVRQYIEFIARKYGIFEHIRFGHDLEHAKLDEQRSTWRLTLRLSDGVNLHEFWAEDTPRAYLGLLVPRFPNLFIMYGPNSQPVSGGVSLPSWFQIWAAYVGQCLITMIEGGHSTVAVTDLAFKEYNERLDAEAPSLAFVTDTGSVERNYYVNSSGHLLVNTPFETADLYPMLRTPDHDDIEFS
jgi:hypothetical protein